MAHDCEDVDLSLRLRLCGERFALAPDATVTHAYEFAKGDYKWRWLERQPWATIVRIYPGRLLALILPALLASEFAVWLMAVRNGWWRMKALATWDLGRSLPRLLRERRAIQGASRATVSEFAALMTAELSSPYLGTLGRQPLVDGALRLYWAGVRVVLRLMDRR